MSDTPLDDIRAALKPRKIEDELFCPWCGFCVQRRGHHDGCPNPAAVTALAALEADADTPSKNLEALETGFAAGYAKGRREGIDKAAASTATRINTIRAALHHKDIFTCRHDDGPLLDAVDAAKEACTDLAAEFPEAGGE